MQGLRAIYAYNGRPSAWRALVALLRQYLIDPYPDAPPSGLEDAWSLAMDYDAGIALEDRDWNRGAAIIRRGIGRRKATTAAALAKADAQRTGEERHALRSHAASLHELGRVLSESGSPDCVPALEEAKQLAAAIGDRQGEAICAFNLGHAFLTVVTIRNLDAAERCYRESLALRAAADRDGRGGCLGQLGSVALARFEVGRTAGADEETLRGHWDAALGAYREALATFNTDDLASLAVTHGQLGVVFGRAGAVDQALAHYRQSIAFKDRAQNPFGAAGTRFNVAQMLFDEDRLSEARDYAVTARDLFASLRGTGEWLANCDRLLADIDAAIAAQGDPPP